MLLPVGRQVDTGIDLYLIRGKMMILDKIISKKERTPAEVVVQDVVKVKKGERVLIIANPSTSEIAQDFYAASCNENAITTLMFQPAKTSFDNANPEVLAAISANPDVCFSISSIKLGKDPNAQANPYKTEDGTEYNHIFDYLLDGKKAMRAVWTPGVTVDMMARTASIDYELLQKRCLMMQKYFENAKSVHITAPSGTDLTISVEGRKLLMDNGDFSKHGTGGNIPAGEVFISPVVGKTEGTIVYDGSMTFSDGDSILETPITCKLEKGFVTDIKGGTEARRLLKTIQEAEVRPFFLEKEKKLPQGQAAIYKKMARNIGELGIGLNPAAQITGNMLEDEKAFNTCHFAIGQNFDNDAPCLIHLDGVVKNPTITIIYADDTTKEILIDGILQEGDLK